MIKNLFLNYLINYFPYEGSLSVHNYLKIISDCQFFLNYYYEYKVPSIIYNFLRIFQADIIFYYCLMLKNKVISDY